MKPYRNTLILVAALMLLAAFVYVFEGRSVGSDAATSPAVTVFAYDEQDVTGFELRGDGKAVALAKDEQGKWRLTAPEQSEADEWAFSTVLQRVARLTADAKLADTVDDPATYGLDKPQLIVSFRTKDGRQETLSLGNANPRQTGNYAVKEGSPVLYLINAAVSTDLQQLLTTPPTLAPTPTPGSYPVETPALAPIPKP